MSFRPLHLAARRAFTLFELMIVLAIMAIVLTIGLFPYADILERVALSNSADLVAQEWILAHKEVRNGILFQSPIERSAPEKHAHLLFVFEKNARTITEYLLSGAAIPDRFNEGVIYDFRTIQLERGVSVRKFWDIPDNRLYYLIAPPYATGSFFNAQKKLLPHSEIILTIGYEKSEEYTTRTQDILLRPYLQ